MKTTNKHINKLSNELIDKVKSITPYLNSYKKGDFLIKEGEKQQHVYLIEDGEVTIIKSGLNKTVEIAHQNSGDLVGVDLVFNDKESEYAVVAKKNTKLYRILIEDFKNFLIANNNLSLELIQYVSSLINQIEINNQSISTC